MTTGILFPHQLFEEHELHTQCDHIYLVEEALFFLEFKFHKQKLAFHRASMRTFYKHLISKNKQVTYIEHFESRADIRMLLKTLREQDLAEIHIINPTDNWLEKRISRSWKGLNLVEYENPIFLSDRSDIKSFFNPDKKSFFQTTFYKQQRKKRKILLQEGDQPTGGKWSYDGDNRKKYPKNKVAPAIQFPERDETWDEAVSYVETHFSENPGILSKNPIYPYSYNTSLAWEEQFYQQRFFGFGDYEDAIVSEESILHHSVLTPMLNVGLLNPHDVIKNALAFSKQEGIPINNTEGFIRQIMGWREFIRGMYECNGSFARTKNYWRFHKKIPSSFYNGTTGIPPIDQTIKKVLKTGYCHHIERLMVLGNFMLLCEFDPDEVYKWFMELFIDAYDWVMVPNVYGMSQFADGGTFATKPYISSSNYIRKMSNYPSGDWEATWDGLFWRFMHLHQQQFAKNPRLGMLLNTWEKMDPEKQKGHLLAAEKFLAHIS